VCHDGDIGNVADANDRRAIASYVRAMQIEDEGRHLMKRIAVVIGIVIGIAATPAVVTADSSDQSKRDRYELARTWNTPQGELYGPVEVAPATYGFYSK
jgi:hypothetical protein